MSSELPQFNKYFAPGNKDIWSLINETAASVSKESGKPVANLGQGFFSYSPPQFAIDAAKDAFEIAADNQYAPAKGKPILINALASHYTKKLNRESNPVTPDEILVTTGANEAIFTAFFGLLNKNDEVIVFQPFFDQYVPNVEMAGGKVIYSQLYPPKDFDTRVVDGNEWTIDWDELESLITEKTKLVLINTPHNPIGKVFTKEELTRLGKLAVKHNFIILSDQVYENLYFNGDEFPRIDNLQLEDKELDFEIKRRVLTVGSAGKTFAATGWRIGWLFGSKELIPYCTGAHTRICFSSPAPIQVAVSRALEFADKEGSAKNIDHPEWTYFENMRQEYINKYKIIQSVFDELNIPYTRAEGAYYLLVNFKNVEIPSHMESQWPEEIKDKARDYKLAYWLIKDLGVVCIPPSVFYTNDVISKKQRGWEITDCLRISVCKDDSILIDAAQRLKGLKPFIKK
ncbi:kynurenine--oxoglutarate transaminase [Martiniozyma asiatica (nom. inval.)]|nr:kynurenine--oxoglutarate transaminase [Martiniozyma asiatica]